MSWERVQRRLRAELGEDVYASWFKCLELAEVAPPVVTLSVPTKFLRNWIQQHFLEKIATHFRRENEALAKVVITMRTAGIRPMARSETAARTAEPARKPGAGEAGTALPRPGVPDVAPRAAETRPAETHAGDGEVQVGSPLDKRMVLASFQVGRSNIMAHAAAMQMLDERSRLGGLLYRIGVQLRPLLWLVPRRPDEPWDDAWFDEVDDQRLAALERWTPRRPTLIVLDRLPQKRVEQVTSALGVAAGRAEHPIRLLVLEAQTGHPRM